MVVHNTYLQVWGDFGLFGLAGIFLVYFGWFALVPRILNKLQNNINLKENVVVSLLNINTNLFYFKWFIPSV